MQIGEKLRGKILAKLSHYQKDAHKVLRNIEDTEEKLTAAFLKAENLNKETGPFNKVYQDVLLLIQLVKAWIRKEYREIPTGSIVAIFAALIYFLSPIDILFDYIPGVGYIDDIFVFGLVFKQLDTDLDHFRAWLQNRSNPSTEGGESITPSSEK